MPTSRVIAAVNPKGGTGKTTVAVHLAVAVHRAGQGVTLLDADPQGSALDWHRRTVDGYDGPDVQALGRGESVREGLSGAGPKIAVVDSPARLDERTGAVLSAADLALVPVRPSGLDLWGTAEFLDVLQDHVERGLSAAFVASQADVRTSLSDELEGALSGLGLPMLDGLTLRVSYARSLSEGRTVLDGGDRGAIEEVEALHNDVTGLL
jgi:chromosome partitioning protein